MTNGQFIRRQRMAHGWTQKDFAGKVGVSVQYMNDIENDRKRPSMRVYERISDVLGVSLAIILTDLSEPAKTASERKLQKIKSRMIDK